MKDRRGDYPRVRRDHRHERLRLRGRSRSWGPEGSLKPDPKRDRNPRRLVDVIVARLEVRATPEEGEIHSPADVETDLRLGRRRGRAADARQFRARVVHAGAPEEIRPYLADRVQRIRRVDDAGNHARLTGVGDRLSRSCSGDCVILLAETVIRELRSQVDGQAEAVVRTRALDMKATCRAVAEVTGRNAHTRARGPGDR